MYSALFRRLPGPTWLKIIEALAIIAIIVVLLFGWVFPWAAENLPISENTVG